MNWQVLPGGKGTQILIYFYINQHNVPAMEHEGDSDTNCNWCTWNNPQRFSKRLEGVGNWSMIRDHPNYSIVEIGQNTEKSPGNLRRLAITQTPVKDPPLMLIGKTHKE